jgi:hypothetical protein
MITLPSHTSHALQPLNVFFVSSLLKQHLERLRMLPCLETIIRNQITLDDWADQALE